MAHVAARAVGGALGSLTQEEIAIVNEARQILASQEWAQLMKAKQGGQVLRVEINGRTIQYQPDLPFAGFLWAEKQGFIISDEAFVSQEQLTKTLLHELHRLANSVLVSGGAVSAEVASKETLAAFQFAEKAFNDAFK